MHHAAIQMMSVTSQQRQQPEEFIFHSMMLHLHRNVLQYPPYCFVQRDFSIIMSLLCTITTSVAFQNLKKKCIESTYSLIHHEMLKFYTKCSRFQ